MGPASGGELVRVGGDVRRHSRRRAAATRSSGHRSRNWHAASHPTAILRGILLMCAGVSLFPFMNAAVKLLGARYPANEIVWARFTGHLIVMLLVFLPQYGGGCSRRGGRRCRSGAAC